MGNTPTQQPFEGDSPDVDEPTAGASFTRRVADAVHSVVDGIRRRLSVFSGLDFGRAFRIEDESLVRDDRLPDTTDGETEPPQLPQVGHASTDGFPKRDRPLTQPVRDREFENAPDLEATETDGKLSIYYPDSDDATITSDTWEPIER
ncbi:hypothetical protein [Halorientalis salina]|uniref:hypothetical protein n=1 Tax=Halorientalis salina TaxID=2932266 RepID=UPI0010ABDB24|nr:hypothetical protein [Halorientalis salina]